MDKDLNRLVARQYAECMTNREIHYEESIVWSVDELLAALTAARRLRSILHEKHDRSSDDAAEPEEYVRLLEEWFDARYRSHAVNVARVHLVRFVKVSLFMHMHRGELERRGWAREGGWGDTPLLRALVAIRCPPDVVLSAPDEVGTPIDLDDVLLLRSALEEGSLEVVEFERVPWRSEQAPDEDEGASVDPLVLDAGRLLGVLVLLEEFERLSPTGQAAHERRVRSELSPGTLRELDEETGRRFMILLWLIEEGGQDPQTARRTVERVLAIDRFLQDFGPNLAHDGLAIWGKRIRWKVLLIEALACIDVSSWPSRPEFTDDEYRMVLAAARFLEILSTGDGERMRGDGDAAVRSAESPSRKMR